MSAHDEAVEAAANAISALRAEWQKQGAGLSIGAEYFADAAITAYLRHMRAAGFVVTRVPEKKTPADAIYVSKDAMAQAIYDPHASKVLQQQLLRSRAADEGFNKAIAATLANAVKVPE